MTISYSFIITLMFIVIRLSPVVLLSPVQAIKQVPIAIRILLVFSLSLVLMPFLPPTEHHIINNLLIGAVTECSNGLILATSIYAVFGIFSIAGQLIDNQTGLNTLTLFNPAEHAQEPISSRLLSLLAVFLFIKQDGLVWLFSGLYFSFLSIPPGSTHVFEGFGPVIKQYGLMFSLSFMMASPLILVLLIIDLSAAFLSRTMPQINIYFLSLPIKISLGFLLLGLMLPSMGPFMNQILESVFHSWQEIMK